MKHKKDIEQEVARLLDMPISTVSLVTGCFLRTLLHEIVDNRDVLVDGFGSFKLREQKRVAVAHLEQGTFKKGGHGGKTVVRTRKLFRVWFKKSNKFRQAIDDAYGKESTMTETTAYDELTNLRHKRFLQHLLAVQERASLLQEPGGPELFALAEEQAKQEEVTREMRYALGEALGRYGRHREDKALPLIRKISDLAMEK